MECTTTVEIASDARTVWGAVADPEAWPRWMDDVRRVEATGPGAPARYGSEYLVKQAWWKFDDQRIQVRHVEPERRFEFVAETSAGRFVFDYVLEEMADRRIAVTSTLRHDDLTGRLAGGMAKGEIEKTLVKEAAQLRDYCEAQSPQDVITR